MITTVQLSDALVGQIVSPTPNGFITRLVLTKSQQPAYQIESHLPLPYPRGRWTSGRFVLTDRGGQGRRLINVSTQHGALTGGHTLMASGQQFAYSGDLVLECLPAGEEWTVDFSDAPVLSQQAA